MLLAAERAGAIAHEDQSRIGRVKTANLRGPFRMARYILPAMRAKKSGFIINVNSEAGLAIEEGHGADGVAK